MEFKRLFTNKKLLAAAVVLILLNLFFFVKQQKDTILYGTVSIHEITEIRNGLIKEYSSLSMTDAYEENVRRCNEIEVFSRLYLYHASRSQPDGEYDELYRSLDTSLRREYPELARSFDSAPERFTEEYFYVNTKVLTGIRKQQEYIIGFGQTIQKIEEQAISEGTVRIFQEDTLFSQNNRQKTVQDFQKVKAVPLQLGNDEFLTSIVDYPAAQYLILMFIVFLLMGFLSERKTGLWEIVHSTRNGRRKLALRRGGILALSIAGMNILMAAGLLLTSLALYGQWGDLFRTVQSIGMFNGFTTPMTVLEFMVCRTAAAVVTDLAVALFLWLVMSASRYLNLGLAVSGAFLAVEWLLYHLLPVQSNFVFFKYVNLFCYIHASQELTGYRNIDFFTFAVGRAGLILVSALVVSCLLAFFCIAMNGQKRPFRSSRLPRLVKFEWIGKMALAFRRFTGSVSAAFSELYKVLFIHKGILILGALCVLLYSGMNTARIYYSPAEYIVNRFYEKYEGVPTGAALKYIEGLAAEIKAAEKEYSSAMDKYRKGDISYNEMSGFKQKWSAYEDKVKALDKIDQNVLYLQTLSMEKRISGWLVNPRAYDHLIGEQGQKAQVSDSLLIVFCMILLLSNLFAYEYRCSMKNLLHSTRKGRMFLFRKKFGAASVLTFVLGLSVYGADMLNVHRAYGFACLAAPIQSIPLMRDCILSCSIGAFLALLYGLRLLFLLTVACGICFLSVSLPQSWCLVTSAAAFLAPAVLSIVGIGFFKILSVEHFFSSLGGLFLAGQQAFIAIPGVVMILSGFGCLRLAKERWCVAASQRTGGEI